MRALILLVVVGCNQDHERIYPPELPPPADADRAVELVRSFYSEHGLNIDQDLDGAWVERDDENEYGFKDYAGWVYVNGDHCFYVVLWEGKPAIHYTSLSHELMHCALRSECLPGSLDHSSPYWDLVGPANELLKAEGM